MSYRTDSDIYLPFSYLRDTNMDLFELQSVGRKWREFEMDSFLAQLRTPGSFYHGLQRIVILKSRKVGWIVSHCNTCSERELYVHELSKFISVDIKGKCVTEENDGVEDDGGGSGKKNSECDEADCQFKMGQTHKFYLAFENSFCKDYASEKYRTALR